MDVSNRQSRPLIRSLLAVPATSRRFLEKASQSSADAIFIDLEDAVAPAQKEKARDEVITALNTLDWGARVVCVRVNGLATSWGCRDILDVVAACPRLDNILLPKCDAPEDIYAAEVMIRSAETGPIQRNPVGLMGLVETPRGIANVEAIARMDGRLVALVFGGGDYQLDLGSLQKTVGAPAPDYAVLTDMDAQGGRQRHWNDLWHFATARLANACRAFGLTPIDGPFSGINDRDGLVAATQRASALGFEGKMAIHPSQIEDIHTVLTPSEAQVSWAENVATMMAQAVAEGRGAVKDRNGEMIDLLHVKLANRIIERAGRLKQPNR